MSEDEPVSVDVSLIEAMLALSVRERLELNDRMIRTALRLREAFRVAEGSDERDLSDAQVLVLSLDTIVRLKRLSSDNKDKLRLPILEEALRRR